MSLTRALFSPPARNRVGGVRDPQVATVYNSGYHQVGGSMLPEWSAEASIREAYLANVFVYACVRIIANTIAALPLRAGKDPNKPQDFDLEAPLARLLGPPPYSPNPDTTPSQLWAHSIASYIVTGRFGWELEWHGKPGKSDLVAVWPLIAQYLEAMPPAPGQQSNKYFVQFAYTANGHRKLFTPEDIYYDWAPSQTSWHQPESALQAARVNISAAIMQDVYDYSFLKNDARPAAIVITEKFADNDSRERFRTQFNGRYGGPRNAGKAIFSEVDGDGDIPVSQTIDIKNLGLSQKDSAAVDRYSSNIKMICIALGVPLSKLDSSNRTFSNAEEEDHTWWKSRILPLVTHLQEAINVRLAPLVGKEVCWFDLSDVDVLQEKKSYAPVNPLDLYDDDVITKNELREAVGEEAVEGGNKLKSELEAERKAIEPVPTPEPTNPTPAPDATPAVATTPPDQTVTETDQTARSQPDESQRSVSPQPSCTVGAFSTEGAARSTPALVPAKPTPKLRVPDNSAGVMVAFMCSSEQASELAADGYEAPEVLHCTLAYLGKMTDQIDKAAATKAVEDFAASHGPIVGTISGKGIFATPDGLAVVALVDCPGLAAFRTELVAALSAAGVSVRSEHDFTAHITLGYAATNAEANAIEVPAGISIGWRDISLVWGGEQNTFELGSGSEAQRQADRRERLWRAVDAQVTALEGPWERSFRALFMRQKDATLSRLEGKRGRQVVRAMQERADATGDPSESVASGEVGASAIFDQEYWRSETMQQSLNLYETIVAVAGGKAAGEFGITFNIQAPFVQDLISERANNLAGQVTETTYSQIKAELVEGVQAGEPIESLANRVSSVFDEASKNRAVTIARTETIGGYNAATAMVGRHYGAGVVGGREWLATRDFRTRESHAIADGQRRGLAEPFDVGGFPMDHPGDGAAPPSEIVNCRCSLALIDADTWATEQRSMPREWRTVREVEDELVRLALEGVSI